MKHFIHCRTLSTRVVRELEMPGLSLCCISCRRSIISGADWKAALSSGESSDRYSTFAIPRSSLVQAIGDLQVVLRRHAETRQQRFQRLAENELKLDSPLRVGHDWGVN